jgi:hypothetical protein
MKIVVAGGVQTGGREVFRGFARAHGFVQHGAGLRLLLSAANNY